MSTRFKTVMIDIETYHKLKQLSEHGFRSIPKEIARLVSAEHSALAEAGALVPAESKAALTTNNK